MPIHSKQLHERKLIFHKKLTKGIGHCLLFKTPMKLTLLFIIIISFFSCQKKNAPEIKPLVVDNCGAGMKMKYLHL